MPTVNVYGCVFGWSETKATQTSRPPRCLCATEEVILHPQLSVSRDDVSWIVVDGMNRRKALSSLRIVILDIEK